MRQRGTKFRGTTGFNPSLTRRDTFFQWPRSRYSRKAASQVDSHGTLMITRVPQRGCESIVKVPPNDQIRS